MITVSETAHLAVRPPAILLEGRLPVLETPAARSLGLHDGQVVRPTVETRDGRLQLVLQGMAIPVPPQLALVAGEQHGFRVRLDPAGRATLHLLAAGGAAGSEAPGGPTPAVAAGRVEQLLLRPPAMPALASLMQPGALQALVQAAPQPALANLVNQVVRHWPAASQLTPDTLRRMMRQGGWTQEAALSRGEGAPAGPDLKSLLRELLSQWDQAPASTRRLLGDALDDIEARQLQSAAESPRGAELALAMLLPFADADPVEIRWSHRDAGRPGEGEPAPWVVDLHTRSSALGEVWLRTQVAAGDEVRLVMWAEQAQVAARAQAAGASLAAWLNEAGLRMASLQVIHGAPPEPLVPAAAAASSGRLVDVRA